MKEIPVEPPSGGPGPVAKVDLSKYRAGPLAKSLTELISLPIALRRIVFSMCALAVLVPLACTLVIPLEELSFAINTGVYGYSIAVGLVLGTVFGVLRMVALAMRNIESILDIILNITRQAAADHQQLQTGTARMPSGGELMESVYEDVALPTIEAALTGAFAFLGRPLYWIYRRSVGSAVRLVILSVQRLPTTEEEERKLQAAAEAGVGEIASYSEQISVFTTKASEVVSHIGARIRFFAMFPLYVLFTVFALIGAVPLLLVWHFTKP